MKVTISPVFGIKMESGSDSLQIDSALSAPAKLNVNAVVTSSIITTGGLYTLSSSTATTQIMPLASSVPGVNFIFRNLSAHQHVLTGSQEAQGTLVFAGPAGMTSSFSAAGQGSKFTMSGSVGVSVVLVSDGISFLVSAMSGSSTINGT